jgi:hypothetical protein
MGIRQRFSFQRSSEAEVCEFLRGLASSSAVQERPGFFVLTEQCSEPAFSFDCEVTPEGLLSDRAGEYFAFLGVFVEALTGRFGAVKVEDV